MIFNEATVRNHLYHTTRISYYIYTCRDDEGINQHKHSIIALMWSTNKTPDRVIIIIINYCHLLLIALWTKLTTDVTGWLASNSANTKHVYFMLSGGRSTIPKHLRNGTYIYKVLTIYITNQSKTPDTELALKLRN